MTPCPECLRYLGDQACVCESECASKGRNLADLIVGAYPTASFNGDYTVQLDLGPAGSPVSFGFGECDCADNTGTFSAHIDWKADPACFPKD